MICEKCKAAGKRSIVKIGGGVSTAMCGHSYYDEDGHYHNHDPNHTTWSLRCSNGHVGRQTVGRGCPHEPCDENKSVRDETIWT